MNTAKTHYFLGLSGRCPAAVEFGFDTNYTTGRGEAFLPAKQQPMPAFVACSGQRFQLLEAVLCQQAIVSRGTLCWLAENEANNECVVKDAWKLKYRQSEGILQDM